jgi:hypothetical protein
MGTAGRLRRGKTVGTGKVLWGHCAACLRTSARTPPPAGLRLPVPAGAGLPRRRRPAVPVESEEVSFRTWDVSTASAGRWRTAVALDAEPYEEARRLATTLDTEIYSSVGSHVRLFGPARVAVSSSDIFLPRSGWSGVAFELRRRGDHRRAMVSGASEPRRQRGCDSRVSDRPFPAPERSVSAWHQLGKSRRCFCDPARGGVVFGQRKRWAEALSTPAERSRPASSWSDRGGSLRSVPVPSPEEDRPGRPL